MQLDMEKYMTRYLSETRENLDALAAALTVMSTGEGDKDHLEAGYRSAHSIKGAARIFGFDRIGNLAEELEIVLHHLWEGRVAGTPGLSEVVLRAHGLLAQLLESERAKTQLTDSAETPTLQALRAISAPFQPAD